MEISEESPKTVRYIIFIAVAVLIVSAIAVPVIASTGSYTRTYTNEGAPYTSVLDTYATEISDGYDGVIFNSEGIYLKKTLDPSAEPILMLAVSDFVSGYPLYIARGTNDFMWVLEYDRGSYTIYEALKTVETEGYVNSISPTIFGCYIQDPNGNRIMTKDGICYTDIDDVIGIGYYYSDDTRRVVFCDGMTAMWSYGGGNFNIEDETEIESESIPDGYYAESMSCNSIYCEYYIGYPFTSEESSSILDSMPYLGALISAIPLIIIAGIILMVVKNKAETE